MTGSASLEGRRPILNQHWPASFEARLRRAPQVDGISAVLCGCLLLRRGRRVERRRVGCWRRLVEALDLGGGAQLLDVLRLRAVGDVILDLAFDVVESRSWLGALIFDLDDVPAELRFH